MAIFFSDFLLQGNLWGEGMRRWHNTADSQSLHGDAVSRAPWKDSAEPTRTGTCGAPRSGHHWSGPRKGRRTCQLCWSRGIRKDTILKLRDISLPPARVELLLSITKSEYFPAAHLYQTSLSWARRPNSCFIAWGAWMYERTRTPPGHGTSAGNLPQSSPLCWMSNLSEKGIIFSLWSNPAATPGRIWKGDPWSWGGTYFFPPDFRLYL